MNFFMEPDGALGHLTTRCLVFKPFAVSPFTPPLKLLARLGTMYNIS
jgi:hypothetical protein